MTWGKRCRARWPFHPARLYAWLERYFVIQQQEMEDEEDDEDSSQDSKDSDIEMNEGKPDGQATGRPAAEAKNREDDMQEAERDGARAINPADLRRMRENADKDLGQVG